jgi:hypothetical protein
MEYGDIKYEMARNLSSHFYIFLLSYIKQDILGMTYVYFKNIGSNLFTHAFPALFPVRFKYGIFTLEFYKIYGVLFLFLIGTPFLFLKKKIRGFFNNQDLEIFTFLYIPVFWFLFTSGITFWQADRILLPAYPLVILLFLFWASRVEKVGNIRFNDTSTAPPENVTGLS